MTLRQRLRIETRARHERLEESVGLQEDASPAAYARFLRMLDVVHPTLEPEFSRLARWVPDVHERQRAARLKQDLTVLGETSPGGPAIAPPPWTDSALLGAMYVFEGSTLGGQVLTRRLELAGVPELALTYIAGYGAQTASRWRAFLAALDSEGIDDDDAVAGAATTFDWLLAALELESPNDQRAS